MTASSTLTFDQNPPHRAVLSELGGGAKENDPNFPPDPVKHPMAEEFNQLGLQAEAANRVLPLAIVWLRFSAGAPIIDRVMCLGNNVTTSDFTPIDNGNGDTTVWWTTGTGGKLPAAVNVKAAQTDDTEIDRCRAFLTTTTVSLVTYPAFHVKTKLGVTGTDANVCVEIY